MKNLGSKWNSGETLSNSQQGTQALGRIIVLNASAPHFAVLPCHPFQLQGPDFLQPPQKDSTALPVSVLADKQFPEVPLAPSCTNPLVLEGFCAVSLRALEIFHPCLCWSCTPTAALLMLGKALCKLNTGTETLCFPLFFRTMYSLSNPHNFFICFTYKKCGGSGNVTFSFCFSNPCCFNFMIYGIVACVEKYQENFEHLSLSSSKLEQGR